jgi:hypothetical protein
MVMKKLILVTLAVLGTLSVQAGGYGHHHYRHHHHRSHFYPSFSFHYGSPYYAPFYGSSYRSYPSYNYDYGYSYSRPNYAVGGTLLGALAGGLIGDSIHHQGWEGAGIGAAAGLVLGSLAERNARAYDRNAYSAPTVSYAQPNYVPNAPVVNTAPTVPDSPPVRNTTYKPANSMGSANSLFGR